MREKKMIGTFCALASPAVADCLSSSGLGFIVIDAEHSSASDETVEHMLRAVEANDVAAYVRVRDCGRSTILRAADMGAAGVIIPDIRSVSEVEDAVRYGKYFPIGRRGLGFARGARYGNALTPEGGIGRLFSETNLSFRIIPQCETVEAVACIDDICRVDGVDGIFVGPFDLSVSLGVPGEVRSPKVTEAVGHVLGACKAHGKEAMIFAANGTDAEAYFAAGFDRVVIGTDVSHLRAGMVAAIR